MNRPDTRVVFVWAYYSPEKPSSSSLTCAYLIFLLRENHLPRICLFRVDSSHFPLKFRFKLGEGEFTFLHATNSFSFLKPGLGTLTFSLNSPVQLLRRLVNVCQRSVLGCKISHSPPRNSGPCLLTPSLSPQMSDRTPRVVGVREKA